MKMTRIEWYAFRLAQLLMRLGTMLGTARNTLKLGRPAHRLGMEVGGWALNHANSRPENAHMRRRFDAQ